MPLGIVSEEEFSNEKSKFSKDTAISIEQSQPVTAQIIEQKIGRGNSKEVPDEMRKIIGEEGLIDRQGALKLAREFKISPSSVSAYRNGATSTASYNDPSKSLVTHLNTAKTRIARKAQKKLLYALDSITEEKLDGAKVTESAMIAKQMSAIVKEMEPEQKEEKQNGPTFMIYAPQFKSEESYETIHAKE